MILIHKQAPPPSLVDYAQQPKATYDDFREKDIVKNELLKEQGYLCAYCMCRISLDYMKIEHHIPQTRENEALGLEYSNMLSVCKGNEGSYQSQTTCDTRKKDQRIIANPLQQSTIDSISYSRCSERSLEIVSDIPTVNHDLCCTLNLNCKESYLPQNRMEALKVVQKHIESKADGRRCSKTMLITIQKKFETSYGKQSDPFCGVVLWYIKKKLNRL